MKALSSLTAALFIALASLTQTAQAALLINPTGGTPITFADVDEGSSFRSLGTGSFTLYGTAYTSLFVQVGGFVSLGNGSGLNTDRTITALAGVTGATIAPLYDDFYVTTTSSVTESITSSYYAITWDVAGYTDRAAAIPPRSQFQAVLFKTNASVNGTAYIAGDILFAYGGLNAPVQDSNFTVGVAQSGTTGTGAFGTTGQFTTMASFLSNFNSATQGILFRPSGGAYTATPQSLVTVVPEASAGVLVGFALPAMAMVAVRRKRRAA